jgi:transposase-like protein
MTARGKHEAVQDQIQEIGADFLRVMVEKCLHGMMEEEVAKHLCAGPHERTASRQGYRNGHRRRSWKTRVGELDLQVPQTRGGDPYHPSFFARWERVERALLTTCAEMYYQGVSTRKVADVLETMGGFSLSAATVSRVASELDEQIAVFRGRPLEHATWPFLVVDARYEKVRRSGRVTSTAVLIVAGISAEGRREILTWRVADTESEDTWRAVFREMKQRGVSGVEVLISDAHKGIQAALAREFQGTAWQRCRVHFIREILKKVASKRRSELANDLRSIFCMDDRKACLEVARDVAAKWRACSAGVARAIEEGIEDCLTVHDLPDRSRRRLHSTNLLERLNRELKRRCRTVGIFPNEAALDRLVGAQLIDIDERWQCETMRYVILDKDAGDMARDNADQANDGRNSKRAA